MKRILSLTCVLVGLAALILGPATAYASPPAEVSGTYEFGTTTVVDVRHAGGNTIIRDITSQELDGDITGSAIFERTFILHSSGKFNVQGVSTVAASVGDRSGTYTMKIVAAGDATTGAVEGKYVVLSGTEELANMRGQGTLTGISNVAGTYSGQLHFDPE